MVALLGAAGAVVDLVRYDDGFPWPVAADALGAGETWLPRRSSRSSRTGTGACPWRA